MLGALGSSPQHRTKFGGTCLESQHMRAHEQEEQEFKVTLSSSAGDVRRLWSGVEGQVQMGTTYHTGPLWRLPWRRRQQLQLQGYLLLFG